MEALELFKKKPEGFDLVITDMTMPVLTGDMLSREIMKVRQEMPVVLCTGFSEHIDEVQAKAIGVREFVMKPLVMNELTRTIRRALDPPQDKTGIR